MADKKSAVISYVDSSNNKGSKTITDIADKIASSKVWAFCEALNALSTNTISQVDLVEKTDITNGGKLIPTFSYSEQTPDGQISIATAYAQMQTDDMNIYVVNFTSDDVTFEDKQTFAVDVKSEVNFVGAYCNYSKMGSLPGKFVLGVMVGYKSDEPLLTAGDTFTVFISETDTTEATELTFTVVE